MAQLLSERSKVTVGFGMAILSLTFWVGVAWARIEDLNKKVDALTSIDRRLSRIEGKLGVGVGE